MLRCWSKVSARASRLLWCKSRGPGSSGIGGWEEEGGGESRLCFLADGGGELTRPAIRTHTYRSERAHHLPNLGRDPGRSPLRQERARRRRPHPRCRSVRSRRASVPRRRDEEECRQGEGEVGSAGVCGRVVDDSEDFGGQCGVGRAGCHGRFAGAFSSDTSCCLSLSSSSFSSSEARGCEVRRQEKGERRRRARSSSPRSATEWNRSPVSLARVRQRISLLTRGGVFFLLPAYRFRCALSVFCRTRLRRVTSSASTSRLANRSTP